MCGGTVNPYGVEACMRGLSPRVRGNLMQGTADDTLLWSIPACAGEPTGIIRK